MIAKTCPGAKTSDYSQGEHTLPLSEFTLNASRGDGVASYCRLCAAAKQREWKRTHPRKVKEWKKNWLTAHEHA